MLDLTFTAPLWLWKTDKSAWTFVTVPPEESDALHIFSPHKGGFGSVRVSVSIGNSRWKTSVFPSKERGGFILPIKKSVRTAEKLSEGDTARITLEVVA